MIQSSIYGRIGKNPQFGKTKTGEARCAASVAVDVGKDPGEDILWVTVLCFGKLAEELERHQPGDVIGVIGRLIRRRYTGSDGQKCEAWRLLADALHSPRLLYPR